MTQPPPAYAQRPSGLKSLRYDRYYMDIALRTSLLSHDTRIKVGAVLVKDGQLVSQGWNGMPAGMDNATRDSAGVTHKEVIHAEANALMKLAKNGGGSDGATLYCTHSPCYNCTGLLLQSGIKRVVYGEVYDKKALTFLKERGITIVHVEPSHGVFV